MDSSLYSDVFRPTKPAQLIGSSQIAYAGQIIKSIDDGAPVKKILFMGQSGTGKTTLSEMYVRHLLKLDAEDNVDDYLTRYNCSSETGIDGIRERILNRLQYKSLGQQYRIYFLDELHGLSKSAQNALLTPLESLPSHVILIAATTEKNKIIETLRSRFLQCTLTSPTREDFMTLAGWLSKKHEASLNTAQVNEIIDRAGSNMREFVNYLQQLIEGTYTTDALDLEKDELIQLMFFSNEKGLTKFFKASAFEEDYMGTCVRICRACTTMIKNGRVKGKNLQNVLLGLDTFGDGLSPNIDESSAFHKLLAVYVTNKA